jgi:HNH endonuclease
MNAALRAFVRARADRRCEYCRLHEDDAGALTFQIEHIIARQHGGTDDADDLCYACPQCNRAKGPNLAGRFAGKLYPLFNPRTQNWHRHFYWDHTILVGKTKTGIVTVQVLNINHPARVRLRENLLFEGRFPPEE